MATSHNSDFFLACVNGPVQVKRHFRLSCDRLQSVSSCSGTLWCCKFPAQFEAWHGSTYWTWMEIKSLSLRLQGQYTGGFQERHSETPPESARTAKRKHEYVQLYIAVTWGSVLHQYSTLAMLSVDVMLISFCVCVRERNCGVFASTRLKCVFGTLRTQTGPFTASLFQTASDVTA